jgi:hypothetical protein
MENELIEHAVKFFETPEKWNAFLEMVQQKDKIKEYMYKKLEDRIYQHFKQKQYNGLEFDKSGNHFIWGFECADKTIWLELHQENLKFCVNNGSHEGYIEKLKSAEYSFFCSYTNLNEVFDDKIDMQDNNWSFVDFISELDGDHLAWYAENKTNEFLNQIKEKIDRFATPEIQNLIKDLHEKTKIAL